MESSINKRLLYAVEETGSLIGKIDNIEILGGGINNLVAAAKSETGKTAVIKLYKNESEKDGNIRQDREKDMISYLNSIGINKHANILGYDKRHLYTIFEHIDGCKIKRLELDDIKEVGNFLVKINKQDKTSRDKLVVFKDAAEPLLNYRQFREGIMNRFEELIENTNTEHNSSIHGWLKKEVVPRADKINLCAIEKEKECVWKSDMVGSYISPSDIGIHNMIRTQQCIKFIDFEYSGKDDISKVLTDLACQPENLLTRVEEQYLLDHVCKLFYDRDATIRERCMHIKPLIGLKWICIMHKTKKGIRIDEEKAIKAIKYYEKLKCF